MACYFPIPCPCELCPQGKVCNIPTDKRKDCVVKTDEEYLNWKATHPFFGMTFQELNQMQH